MTRITRAKSTVLAPKIINGFDSPRQAPVAYPIKLFAQVGDYDTSGDIIVANVNFQTGHVYEVRCSIFANYDNESDRFRGHLYENGTLVSQAFSNTWGHQYYDSITIEHVSQAGSDGTVEYKLNLAEWSPGVKLKRFSMVIMDLGPN